jgi:hypothetical protein
MKAKEDCLDQVYSDQMVLGTVRLGGWTMWVVAKDTQTMLNLKGDHVQGPGLSPFRSDGSSGCQVGILDHVNGDQRLSRESQKTTLASRGTYLKTGIVTA